jgi:pimeloyl-ACP methyl ester carboxylesterase
MSSVKLHFKSLGEGPSLLILHGLFGSLDNWQTHAKILSNYFRVILVDARNHGHSPHTTDHNYELLAEDLLGLINDLQLDKVTLLGHSMGGKAVMRFAQLHPERVNKLIVVDMGVKAYPMHHDVIVNGLKSIDFDIINTRASADVQLTKFINDVGVRQFLMKNLYWIEPGKRLAWRMNINTLEREMSNILSALPEEECSIETLFLYGTESNYVLNDDFKNIESIFKNVSFESIQGAGHWVHAEKPQEFLDAVLRYLLV